MRICMRECAVLAVSVCALERVRACMRACV